MPDCVSWMSRDDRCATRRLSGVRSVSELRPAATGEAEGLPRLRDSVLPMLRTVSGLPRSPTGRSAGLRVRPSERSGEAPEPDRRMLDPDGGEAVEKSRTLGGVRPGDGRPGDPVSVGDACDRLVWELRQSPVDTATVMPSQADDRFRASRLSPPPIHPPQSVSESKSRGDVIPR